eukprot:GFUD01007432.1.p1 GENE.GFUD01007432.1~~GFUD01007432.1.p1  ORF type:complete len:179 (+),score=43.12 GFUD01007432.1:51-587(+)
MACSSVLTTSLSLTGILLSLSSLYITTMLSKDKNFVAPCDLSPTLSCSSFLSTPYSTGLGLVRPLLGEDHSANLPNSVFSIVVFTIIFATNFFSNQLVTSLMLGLATTSLLFNTTISLISLPVMCPISLTSLVTTMLMVLTIMCQKRSLDTERKDKYGYSIPTTTTNNNNKKGFKKFI